MTKRVGKNPSMTRRQRATAGRKPAADRPAARVLAGGETAPRVAVSRAHLALLHRDMVTLLRKGADREAINGLLCGLEAMLGDADAIDQTHADLMNEASEIMIAHFAAS